MVKQLLITDERMFKLIEWAIRNDIVGSETEFLDKISYSRTNINKVRNGLQSFRIEHIINACELTGSSADYIFGFTNQVARKSQKKPIDLLKEAVSVVEQELTKKK